MSPSSRWCSTPGQLMILEEMYRGGVKTPNASQIQQITAHLSFYGKIEGKNVFYWFQNHKARDRQKLRRRLCKQQHQQQQNQLYQNQQNQLLHYLQQPPSYPYALHQLSHSNSPAFLPRGGVEDASAQMMSYTWKEDLQEMYEMENSLARTYGGDLTMMMMEMGPTTTCYNRPLKTLELFPVEASSLKEESTTSNHISFPKSTN